jgi:hypothetical protein
MREADAAPKQVTHVFDSLPRLHAGTQEAITWKAPTA